MKPYSILLIALLIAASAILAGCWANGNDQPIPEYGLSNR